MCHFRGRTRKFHCFRCLGAQGLGKCALASRVASHQISSVLAFHPSDGQGTSGVESY